MSISTYGFTEIIIFIFYCWSDSGPAIGWRPIHGPPPSRPKSVEMRLKHARNPSENNGLVKLLDFLSFKMVVLSGYLPDKWRCVSWTERDDAISRPCPIASIKIQSIGAGLSGRWDKPLSSIVARRGTKARSVEETSCLIPVVNDISTIVCFIDARK